MGSDIDPVEFGKLIQSVDQLATTVTNLQSTVDDLRTKVTGGKGVIVGMLIAAGGLGAGTTKLIERVLHG